MSDDIGNAPESARKIRLEELVSPFPGSWGSDRPSADTREFLVLGVGNVTNEGELNLKGATIRHLTRKEMGGVAEEGDLVVVKSSGSAANIRSGKAAICPAELSGKIACSNFMIRLKVKRDLADPYLLWLILNSQAAKKFVREIVGASTYPNIKWENYRRFEFELPSLKQQQRLTARLRERLSILTEARAAFEAQLKAAEALPTANLRAVFESEEARRWPRLKLEELCEIVATQVSPTDVEFADLPHVNGENIESGTLQLNNVRSAREDRMMSGKYLFQRGDVLYSKLRPYLRKVAIAPWRGLCSADMYPLRVQRDRLDEKYAAWLLLSDEFTKYAIGESQRSRMPKLNREQLFAWNAPVPPLETQRAITSRLDAEFSVSRALRESIHGKLSELEKLPAALLRSAFNPNGG
jgi:type I restriction enzyme S subunit